MARAAVRSRARGRRMPCGNAPAGGAVLGGAGACCGGLLSGCSICACRPAWAWRPAASFFWPRWPMGCWPATVSPSIVDAFKDARDAAANAAGFRIVSIALVGRAACQPGGNSHRRRRDRHDLAPVLRRRRTPATVSRPIHGSPTPQCSSSIPTGCRSASRNAKPSRCGRQAGRVSVIAADGTVLEPYVDPRLIRLPLVVGHRRGDAREGVPGAARSLSRAARSGACRGPGRRAALESAAAERPRHPPAGNRRRQALTTLAGLDRDKKLLSRDIVAVDLRLPDRVTVQLSDAAAAQRAEELKDKKPAKKGGAA